MCDITASWRSTARLQKCHGLQLWHVLGKDPPKTVHTLRCFLAETSDFLQPLLVAGATAQAQSCFLRFGFCHTVGRPARFPVASELFSPPLFFFQSSCYSKLASCRLLHQIYNMQLRDDSFQWSAPLFPIRAMTTTRSQYNTIKDPCRDLFFNMKPWS